MNYAKLRKHVNALACLPNDASPVVSAYFDLSGGPTAALREYDRWTSITSRAFAGAAHEDFVEAAAAIPEWLKTCQGRSAALFCRRGRNPMFLPMVFEVPLENHFHAGDLPAIYPLVELKDRFNRFVVALLTEESARIVELNLGNQSLELLATRPALRERIGREWTREHYNNHKRDRDRRFLKEKIAVIESLMAKHGHNSLIIAGDPRHVNRLTEALPAHLKQRLVAEIKTGFSDRRLGGILEEAVESFLRAEREEAHDTVALLMRAVRAGGLASVGFERTMQALREGRVEQLIVSSALDHAQREELVRQASRQAVPIETVQGCELLDRNGGAGALLRFAASFGSREETAITA